MPLICLIKNKLSKVNDDLVESLSHLIFYDHEILKYNLTSKQVEFFLEHNNARAWNKLMKENPALYRKRKPLFKKSIRKITGTDWSDWLKEDVQKKSNFLLSENI